MNNEVIKFESGKSYRYGDSYITIASRTAKTIKTTSGPRRGIEVINGVETLRKGTCGYTVTNASEVIE